MRMRKKTNLSARLAQCAQYQVPQPAQLRGNWRTLMPDAKQIRLELGCGKGRFTAETAAANPQDLYLALERVPDAMVIAMERAQEMNLKNLFFIDADAAFLRQYFAPDEVDVLYINFCDPWPSKKHAKRRMTHDSFLILYRGILKTGGEIHFKTDNADLFDFSLLQFPKAGYALHQVTHNLHGDGICGIMTDYEEKFHLLGTPIHRCVGEKLAMAEEPVFSPVAIPGGGRLRYGQADEQAEKS